jgi:SAM-dependent methyltransferase
VDPKGILNLGCGNEPIAGATNHDRIAHRPEVDVAHDLNVLPWPWEDNSFRRIVAQAVFEHLRNTLIESLDECWRILKPDGALDIRIPWWQHDNSYRDPTHYWQFSLSTLDIFVPETDYGAAYGFYTPRKWRYLRRPELSRHKSSITALMQVVK